MSVGIAIATYGRLGLLEQCLGGLNQQSIVTDFDVQIMDGNEDHSVVGELTGRRWGFRNITVVREQDIIPPSARGRWPAMYNALFRKTGAKYVTYWSDDVVPDNAGCFERAVKIMDDSAEIGAVAFRWRDGGHPYKVYRTDIGNHPLINFGLIRKAGLDKVGLLDEGYAFYCADQDVTLKLATSGMRIHSCEHSDHECSVTHWSPKRPHNVNRSPEHTRDDVARFMNKWQS